ncbi:MAG: fluoride efflux transporter CrcB [Flavisolibacter sp.]|jgi:CrcB protein|nr:fluoride efflux transporter CrcB [Flavisolibacter sp.]
MLITINNLFLLGLAGGSGTILRFLIQKKLNGSFPYGTLAVNIVGCFVIGLVWGYFAKQQNMQKQILLAAGFCGGFTTFSAFTAEGLQMIMDHRLFHFFIYTAGSILIGLLITFLGFKITS